MRRCVVPIAAVVVVAGLAACDGGGSANPFSTDPPEVPTPTTAPAAPDEVALPDDPQAVVVDVDGQVRVTASGLVYRPADDAVQPGGLRRSSYMAPAPPSPSALEVAELTTAGLAALMARALELDLLGQPPEYGDPLITDQGSRVVTITTADSVVTHSVYAPTERTGGEDEDAARDRLDEFVAFVEQLDDELGDALGAFEPYVPEQWSVDTASFWGDGDDNPWPFATPAVVGCTSFPADDVTTGGVDGATGVYALGDDAIVVQPLLPGADCPD